MLVPKFTLIGDSRAELDHVQTKPIYFN